MAELDVEVWKRIRRLFSDKAYLEQLIEESSDKNEQKNAALQAEIESLTESISVREKEFDETATAFVAAKGKLKAVLQCRADELETIISELRKRRDERIKKLYQEQESQAQLHTLHEWVEKLGRGLNKADHNFEIKRKFINILDVVARLSIIDDEKITSVNSELGEFYEQ